MMWIALCILSNQRTVQFGVFVDLKTSSTGVTFLGCLAYFALCVL